MTSFVLPDLGEGLTAPVANARVVGPVVRAGPATAAMPFG